MNEKEAFRIVARTWNDHFNKIADEYEAKVNEDDNYRHPGWRPDFLQWFMTELAKQDLGIEG